MELEWNMKTKEEIFKQIDAGLLEETDYLEWLTNIVPRTKKYGKVRMCVDYHDFYKVNPTDDFCYNVIHFGLENASATYYRETALFQEMMHKEIEVYVKIMIAKSKPEEDHLTDLKKIFELVRKDDLKPTPTNVYFRGNLRQIRAL